MVSCRPASQPARTRSIWRLSRLHFLFPPCRTAPGGRPILESSRDFTVRNNLRGKNAHSMLRINKLKLENAGVYTITVTNGKETRTRDFELVIRTSPKVKPPAQCSVQTRNGTRLIFFLDPGIRGGRAKALPGGRRVQDEVLGQGFPCSRGTLDVQAM